MHALVDALARGALTHAPAEVDQLVRAMQIDRRYGDLHLGLVHSSVIALAEQLGVRRIATRDVRHFAAIRFRDGSSFELVVSPSDPDR